VLSQAIRAPSRLHTMICSMLLQRLDLSHNELHDEDALQIAKALQKDCVLQHMDISGHRIYKDGMWALCTALAKMVTSLQTLKLGTLWDIESQAAVGFLLRGSEGYGTLRGLSLSSRCLSPHIFQALAHNTTLQSIHMESHTNREEALVSLAAVLHTNVFLTHLHAAFQGASGLDSLVAIGKALLEAPRLRPLKLSGVGLSKVADRLGLPACATEESEWPDATVAEYIHGLNLDKITAYAMSQHHRLGAESLARNLSADCARMVVLSYFGLRVDFVPDYCDQPEVCHHVVALP
jgi:hypothetical protein